MSRVIFHRPARVLPPQLPTEPVVLAAPPQPVGKEGAAGRDRYLEHLDEVRRAARQVAEDQRVIAAWSHPSPYRLWAIATQRRRVWERRSTDPDFLHVCVGVGRA